MPFKGKKEERFGLIVPGAEPNPRFTHHCGRCVFHGHHRLYDVYSCWSDAEGFVSLMARWSSMEECYVSFPASVVWQFLTRNEPFLIDHDHAGIPVEAVGFFDLILGHPGKAYFRAFGSLLLAFPEVFLVSE